MQLLRHVTVVTANLGRGATVRQFKDNVDRIVKKTPGKSVFYGFQEIDEADKPEELAYIRKVLGETHRFVGTKTKVPIAVPRSFEISRRVVEEASDGVAKLQPDRFIVRALVHPVDHPNRKVNHTNTHFGRNVPELRESREEMDEHLRKEIARSRAGWLTADLNKDGYPPLGNPEKRLVEARLDVIRAHESDKVRFRLLNTGTIRLVGDGHNAHWAKMHVIWR